jgi:hypothetical protein
MVAMTEHCARARARTKARHPSIPDAAPLHLPYGTKHPRSSCPFTEQLLVALKTLRG